MANNSTIHWPGRPPPTQFRVEIFSLFNALNLGNPSTSLSGGGLILGTRNGGNAPGIGFGEPRNVQFALKFIF